MTLTSIDNMILISHTMYMRKAITELILCTMMYVVSTGKEKEVGGKDVGKPYESIDIWLHEMLLFPIRVSSARL